MSTTTEKLLAGLRKQFGETARIGTATDLLETRRFCSSGSLALDLALGNNGWPTNRLVEICGAEGVGKSSAALLAVRTFLLNQPKRSALYLDLEHKLDVDWVTQLVGEELMDRMIFIQPPHIEQATDMYTSAVSTGDVAIAVLDSIGGSPTIRTTAKSAEIASYGGNAIGVGNFARLAAGASNIHDCLTIGINQVRADMAGLNRTMRPGGHAWLHAITQSVVLKRGQGKVFERIGGEDVQVGQEVRAKVIKSGISPPGRTATYWFFNVPTTKYPLGIDTMEEIVRLAVLTGVVTRTGGYYSHPALPGGKVLGKDRLQELIRDDRSLYDTLRSETMAHLSDHADQVAPISDPDTDIPDDTPAGFHNPLEAQDG